MSVLDTVQHQLYTLR